VEEDKKIINFTSRKVKRVIERIDEAKHFQDLECLEGEDLKDAITRSVEEGNINISSLAECLMNFAAALDELEYKFATLSAYVVLKLKEKDLIETDFTKKDAQK